MVENKSQGVQGQLSFNMGVDYIQKIAQHLSQFELLWSQGRLEKSSWELKLVFYRLSPFLMSDEEEFIEKSFDSLQKSFAEGEKKPRINQIIEGLYRHILKKLNKYGLLIPTSDDPRFMFKKKR